MSLRDKDGKFAMWARVLVIAVFFILLCAMSYSGVIYSLSKEIEIIDNGQSFNLIYTDNQTVGEALQQAGISLNAGDTINVDLDTPIADQMDIIVDRAEYVTIHDGKTRRMVMTHADTVEELLTDYSVAYNSSGAVVSVPLETPISDGMEVVVDYFSTKEQVESDIVPYETDQVDNPDLEAGKTQVAQEGKDGLLNNVYKLTYKNGELVSRILHNTVLEQPPVAMVIENGVKPKPTPEPTPKPKEKQPVKAPSLAVAGLLSRSGSELRYSNSYEMTASAYTLSSSGKSESHPDYGVTASGYAAERGVVAVDKSVIPLGTRLYIEAEDGSWSYGYAVAADTGASVKGMKVDLFVDSHSEAMNFGLRKAKVYILE